MKKFLKNHHAKDKLKVFIVSFLTITFLAVPVLAEEMSPEEKLAEAAALSTRASEMAIKAKETGDVELAKQALAIARKASGLIADVASYADETGNTELAQAALDMIDKLEAAINQIGWACQYLVQTSPDPDIVAAANAILAEMAILIASGAVPGLAEGYSELPPGLKIPGDDESPIEDTEAASSV
jgi:hypothetical protein